MTVWRQSLDHPHAPPPPGLDRNIQLTTERQPELPWSLLRPVGVAQYPLELSSRRLLKLLGAETCDLPSYFMGHVSRLSLSRVSPATHPCPHHRAARPLYVTVDRPHGSGLHPQARLVSPWMRLLAPPRHREEDDTKLGTAQAREVRCRATGRTGRESSYKFPSPTTSRYQPLRLASSKARPTRFPEGLDTLARVWSVRVIACMPSRTGRVCRRGRVERTDGCPPAEATWAEEEPTLYVRQVGSWQPGEGTRF